jgi:hypothetical protein
MKARKVNGVWLLKELGFKEDFKLRGKHYAEVIIEGKVLNLLNGEIYEPRN